jgi:serine O-acetyltransferase
MEPYIDSNLTKELVKRQLSNLFIYSPNDEDAALDAAMRNAIPRCVTCFGAVSNKYFQQDGRPCFNVFHSGQYSIFLYYLSNSLWALEKQTRSLADRVYYLNKALNGLDLYYEVEMPDIFFLDHAIGSVLGRAKYGNYFSFSQNCTIGNNKGLFPKIGENVCLMSGAKVIGNCVVGDHVIISANTYVKDQNIPSHSIVFGSSPNLLIKRKVKQYFLDHMKSKFLIPQHFINME